MPLLFAFGLAMGGVTDGAFAAHGHGTSPFRTTMMQDFDAAAYASVSDCLTAASIAGAELSVCTNKE
jgi:hypothetical protein